MVCFCMLGYRYTSMTCRELISLVHYMNLQRLIATGELMLNVCADGTPYVQFMRKETMLYV